MPRSRLPGKEGTSRLKALLAFAPACLVILVCLLVILVSPVQAAPVRQAGTGGGQGEQVFQTKCSGCHTVGKGKLVGPDLQGVTQRRDEQWVKSFISDPNKMFAANDPTALQLLKENNGLRMPALGLSAPDIDALATYLQGPPTSAPGAVAAGAALAAGDAAAGQRLFTGELGLQNGGPACLACHTAGPTGSLGGGALGPDLTHVLQRYGEPGLAAALQTIAFPTMAGPFANRPLLPREQADLVAFLKQLDAQAAPVPVVTPGSITQNTWLVLGIALAGMTVLFALLLFAWPRQRQSVSARLRSGNR